MPEEEFRDNIEALATKRLEKPKTSKAQAERYWSEVDSGFYLFNRSNFFLCFHTCCVDWVHFSCFCGV